MRRGIFVPLCLAALLCALLTGCREERQNDHTDLDAKPVLYLYPEKETEVNVRLDYDGELTCTYPAYGEEGWTVTAAPDGTHGNGRAGCGWHCQNCCGVRRCLACGGAG